MHIVFVSREYVPTFRGGGIASYIKETAIGLVKKGHRVTVICASDDTNEESEYMDDVVFLVVILLCLKKNINPVSENFAACIDFILIEKRY